MLVSTLFDEINQNYRGSDDVAPTEGTTDADSWLIVINQKKDQWATDPFESWSSLFVERNLSATVVAGDDTYALDTDFIRVSDRIYVTDTSGNKHHFLVIAPEERDIKDGVYIVGHTLYFNGNTPTGTALAGGTITVPGYYLPDDLTAFSDTVPVDDPHWLAKEVAAQLAFNDVSYEDKAPDIQGQANDLYIKMKQANRDSNALSMRTIPTNVQRIRVRHVYPS